MIWNNLSPSESIDQAPGALLKNICMCICTFRELCIYLSIYGANFSPQDPIPNFDIPLMMLFLLFCFFFNLGSTQKAATEKKSSIECMRVWAGCLIQVVIK